MAKKTLSSSGRHTKFGAKDCVHRTPEEKREESLRQIMETSRELRDVSNELELSFLAYLLDMVAEEAGRYLDHDTD